MYSDTYPAPVIVGLVVLEQAAIFADGLSQLTSPTNVVQGFSLEVPFASLAVMKVLYRWHGPGMFVENSFRTVEGTPASNPC
jgi:hypothetical protein